MGTPVPKRSIKIKDDNEFVKDWKSGMPLMKIAEKHGLKEQATIQNGIRLGLRPPRNSRKKTDD